ncbi:MAG: T9SS type A sorting domain-containing protein [Bacteroidetes bacterium]|nr:T9SS type A sorting domain-containing protein [Bacteroidota bacterium]
MKTNYTIFFFVLFLNIQAQTIIPVNSSVSGNWTKTNSPYLIKGNISVPKDSCLTIEHGVEIRFDGKYQLSVYGKIKALGKVDDTIRFYPQDTLNRWRGIRFYGNNTAADSAIFQFCRFEYTGPKLSNFESALTLKRGHFLIENCSFLKNTTVIGANSIITDSTLSCIIRNCYFYRNSNVNSNPAITQRVFGVIGISYGKIENCIFYENGSFNPYNSLDKFSVTGDGSGGIIYVYDISNKDASVEILNCKFIKNTCALRGAGIDISFNNNGKLKIYNCHFESNRTGRYGCISSVGNTSSPNGLMKLEIENCSFKNNVAANTTVADGVAAIFITLFNSNDSIIIRNNLFESNTARSIVSLGNPNCNNQYLIGNLFRGNALWCLSAESRGDIWSLNNIYTNNSSLILIKNAGNTNRYLRSVNDAFLYNGPNLDTIALDLRLLSTYSGIYYKMAPTVDIFGGNGGVFRNCIFKGNKGYDGKSHNFTINSGRIYELSNCLFDSNIDSSIVWESDINQPRPASLVLLDTFNIIGNPFFIKSPQTFGPKGMDTTADFHLINTCSQLSPAYNKGFNSAYPILASLKDMDGHARISCDTVDIGPYELGPQYARVQLFSHYPDTAYCDNDMSLVHKSTCNPNSIYTVQKQNGSAWTDIYSSASGAYTNTKPSQGKYRVIYTQLDCDNSDTGNTFNIALKPSPKPFLGHDTTIEQKSSLVLNPGQFDSYKWQDGSGNSTFTINGNSSGIGQKSYSVTVTSSNACSASDTIQVTVTWNSSFQSILDKGWKVYPNPTNGIIYLDSPNGDFYSVELTDWMGNSILIKNNLSDQSTINIAELPSGVYHVKLITIDFIEVIKVLKL